MTTTNDVYDITIIGGGPVGLFTAFYAGMRQMKTKIIESMPQLGGQLSVLYPDKYIYDVAGFPKVKAQKLVDDLEEQAMLFDPTIVLEQSAEQIERLEDGSFKLTTNTGDEHFTKTIIITAGIGAFQPKRLPVEGSEQYENANLHYFVKDINAFKGKRVVVCGGGDSAVDWALMLEPIAEEVTIVHRRDKFRAHEHSVEQMMNSSIIVKTPFEVNRIIDKQGKIAQVVLKEAKGEKEETLDLDDLVVNYGFSSSLGPIKDWGLEVEKNSIVVNTKMETNIKGIYAAGDVVTYDGKVKLIATGFGEAPIAVSSAKTYIDPSARMQPQHSTSLMADDKKKVAQS